MSHFHNMSGALPLLLLIVTHVLAYRAGAQSMRERIDAETVQERLNRVGMR